MQRSLLCHVKICHSIKRFKPFLAVVDKQQQQQNRMSESLRDKVTGSSRGIGKGIAIELGIAGATVYVTGRTPEKSESSKVGASTLEEVANEITKRGGRGIVAYCDHSNPLDVKALFERIEKEQNGQLDLLVNNAFSAVYYMMQVMGKKFYDVEGAPEDSYEAINNVGLRNNYVCSVYAARLMAKRKRGMIVNISSIGGINYLFNVPYGLGKEALIRMSADMAIELADKGVNSIALLPGGVKTEFISATVLKGPDGPVKSYFVDGESIYYSGRVIAFLMQNPEVVKLHNGKAITTTEIGESYGLLDVDDKKHPDLRVNNYKKYVDDMNAVHLELLAKR